MSAEDAALQKFDLYSSDLQYLKTLSGIGKQNLTRHITKISADPQEQKNIMSSFVKMSNLGYLKDSGFIIRSILITDNGESLLQKVASGK